MFRRKLSPPSSGWKVTELGTALAVTSEWSTQRRNTKYMRKLTYGGIHERNVEEGGGVGRRESTGWHAARVGARDKL
jgi:hypothetical protein